MMMKRVAWASFSLLLCLIVLGNMSSWAGILESLLPPALPEGWLLIEGPRLYTRRTLFEHIDGQAELYFKYGYRSSLFAVYQDRKKSENQIEIDLCDMGNVLQAFGMFSRLRTEGQKPGEIGLDSLVEDRFILFYKGRYLVTLYGTESNPSAMKELALAVSSRITDSSPMPREIGLFPVRGLRSGSIQYFPEGLLGHQFLPRGFQAAYAAEEGPERAAKEIVLFLAIFNNSQDAARALRAYRDYLGKEGALSKDVSSSVPGTLRGEDPYKGKVLVVQKRVYLAGIAGFENEKEAEDRLGELLGKIK